MKRTAPLRRIGARAKREAEALAAFRADPPERCERCGRKAKLDPHHRLPRSRGGKHTPENRAWLCAGPNGCHARIHDHDCEDWKAWIA